MAFVNFFVLGLDGATLDIIKPMVEAGKLPAFSMMMSTGVWGELESTVLPVTPPAWSSFMTGKNPGKHGVYGFFETMLDSYETSFVTSHSIKAKKIWDYFDKDKKIALVDIPLTYPPQQVNGCMISGMPVPSKESIFTFPPDLHTELIAQIGPYMIDNELRKHASEGTLNALQHLYDYTEMRMKAVRYLIKKLNPINFFMVVLRGSDFIQHAAFKYLDEDYAKRHPHEAKKYGNIIFQFYEKLDSYLQEILKLIGIGGTLIVMSDHGCGPLKRFFYINRWLKQEGFLTLKTNVSFKKQTVEIRKKPIETLMERVGLPFINSLLPDFIKRKNLPYIVPKQRHPSNFIDWQKTSAYANLTWTDGVIRINLKGKQPNGCVKPEDYNAICTSIVNKLRDLVDPLTNKKVMEAVYKKEEIYHGPYLEDAPDIIALTSNIEYAYRVDIFGDELFETPEDPSPATHRMNGIFMMRSTHTKTGVNLTKHSIMDIAPTILYLMGVPIPDDMDGVIIKDAIEYGFLAKHKPSYYKEEDSGQVQKAANGSFDEEERKEVEENLRNLGYLS
ncbi:MAG: alkaline phosphatase family protein [Candidatus Magnetoovum sp. WYHC-5]|nr:alkaline phosphatase family protein [Candidatus Magnetoovum sp. WYHC-5]